MLNNVHVKLSYIEKLTWKRNIRLPESRLLAANYCMTLSGWYLYTEVRIPRGRWVGMEESKRAGIPEPLKSQNGKKNNSCRGDEAKASLKQTSHGRRREKNRLGDNRWWDVEPTQEVRGTRKFKLLEKGARAAAVRLALGTESEACYVFSLLLPNNLTVFSKELTTFRNCLIV